MVDVCIDSVHVPHVQVRKTVQQQLAQALFKLSVEFRKEETRFLNRMEAQKGLEAGSSLGLVEDDGGTAQDGSSYAVADPGFTQAQMMRVNQAEGLAQERDEEIRKVGCHPKLPCRAALHVGKACSRMTLRKLLCPPQCVDATHDVDALPCTFQL